MPEGDRRGVETKKERRKKANKQQKGVHSPCNCDSIACLKHDSKQKNAFKNAW
ncbi:hypothetical protein CHS0354_033547, partial [Potamilus streckersoni]